MDICKTIEKRVNDRGEEGGITKRKETQTEEGDCGGMCVCGSCPVCM